jgi:prolyl oligopeptidase
MAEHAQDTDPHAWLEEVHGAAALQWVGERNAVTLAELEGDARHASLLARLTALFDARDRIPHVVKHGEHFYNFWRDQAHPRGLWRRTTLDQYRLAEPAWECVLDLDELARDEGENWVWGGARFLPPAGRRCLLSFSRGGGDACVVREFDTVDRAFVAGGFALPEAKSDASWVDIDTLLVGTDTGPGSLTSSGYPRVVRQWRRGTPLAQAAVVYEAQESDLSASGYQVFTPGHAYQFIERQITFYTSELFLREGDSLRAIDKPADASAYTVRGQLVIALRSDWTVGADAGTHLNTHADSRVYPQGALLATDFADFLRGGRDFTVLFAPTARRSLDAVAMTANALLLTELDNVTNRIVELTLTDGAWRRRAVDAPALGSLGVAPLDRHGSDQYFLTVNSFLTPSTLYLGQVGSDMRTALKALPAGFDASGMVVKQLTCTSADGTTVPYFVVMAAATVFDGANPTLLYGYGGFEIAMKPAYSAVTGQAWLAGGGVYVLANIRGGGEFGPGWHQGALKQHRQRAFDDFIAVAEDLSARKITGARHLGIMGGSNGGLLVAAVMTQRPELFKAVVCQVPLLDMRRYHRLLAGASWMGEYGDPDVDAEWDYIARYSPYHNVAPGKRYPRVLFTTSTRDDRVHPAHARKMVARMQAQGHDVLYWENMEGGHAGAADNAQQARMWTLTYLFLLRELGA